MTTRTLTLISKTIQTLGNLVSANNVSNANCGGESEGSGGGGGIGKQRGSRQDQGESHNCPKNCLKNEQFEK